MTRTIRKAYELRLLAIAAAVFFGCAVLLDMALADQDGSSVSSRNLGSALGARPDMVTAETERAIDRGLQYLVHAQQNRGSWSSGSRQGGYEGAMTGLAGIALLSSGSTPTRGPYARNVRRAIYWVLAQQNAQTGLFVSRGEESQSMYSHGFCMLFLAESLGECGDADLEARIRTALQKAIKLTEGSQSKLGGWIYRPSGQSDEGSVTVTQVQALRAAQNAGVHVDKKVIDRAFNYLLKTRHKDGGISYSASTVGRSYPAISAASWTCLNSAGRQGTDLHRSVRAYCLGNWDTWLNQNRRSFGHFFYANHYLAQAMAQDGGEAWNRYYPLIRDLLLKEQLEDGNWRGDNVGDVYGTAIALSILQLPYNYLTVVQK